MIRRSLLLLVLLLIPQLAAAQETGGFPIETITVEGGRRAATQGIVIAESRLATGRAWSERELREAIYRIRRLPFIVHADFALRRGSERGLYALAITVEETRPFFFAREVEVLGTAPERLSYSLGYGYGFANLRNAGTAGGRLFLGARNVLFGSVDTDEGIQAGFTRYGLFGGGGSATATYGRSVCCRREVLPLGIDPELVDWSTADADRATLTVDVPLAGNHSLRTSLSWLGGEASSRRGLLDDFRAHQYFGGSDRRVERRKAEVKWFYDTADDPLFPSHGVTLSGGIELFQQTAPAREGGIDDFAPPTAETDARLLALAVTGRRSWSLSPRQAVSVGGRLAAGRSRIDNLVSDGRLLPAPVDLDSLESSVEARYSASLWGFERTRDFGDLRFETFARFGYDTTSPSFGGPLTQLSAGSSLAFRNGWGVFRVGFTYLEMQRSRR
jgi:hypothetical protein